MCTHLARVGSTYYFRLAVPQELRRFVLTKTGMPRAEFMESLGTKDRDDAKRLLPNRVKLAHAELDEARLVPLHAHLIEQEFLDVVKAQGAGPLFYDPESKRTAMRTGISKR